MGRPRIGISFEERFWGMVRRGGPDDCWPWLGVPNRKGYGRLRVGEDGHKEMAHRVAWELAFGPILEGMLILHHCDSPPCCNPSHLFPGDELLNAQDREAKGRGHDRAGVRNPRARMTERKVRTLRAFYAYGIFNQYQLAEIYDTTQGVVSKTVRREIWENVV